MIHLFAIVRSNGGYLRKDGVEFRIKQDCNNFHVLQERLLDEDHSEEPNDGWVTIFITN